MQIAIPLVDVISLSQKKCDLPIRAHLAYATTENFVGRVVAGYTPELTDFALLEATAAEALCQVQNELHKKYNLSLLIYDSYRPKRAVLDFMRWSNEPVATNETGQHELAMKQKHYPHIEKNQLFKLGYVSEDSNHCYGNTVDLVLIDKNNQELPLGACFDFMDELSHHSATPAQIGEEAFLNRQLLLTCMQEFGFVPYTKEFWHYHFHEKKIIAPIDIVMTEDLRSVNVT